jgi:hypothetical protein
MCVNNIHTQVRHHRGVEEKEEEEPPQRSLEALPRLDMNWDKNWHDASPLVGTLLDLPSRITLLVWGSLLFGEFYLDLDLLHTRVCNSIKLIGLFPTWNSIPCKSISHKEFYSWSLFLVILLSWWIEPMRTTVCILCVWVCLRFVCRVHHVHRVLRVHPLSPPQISWIREDWATPKGSTPIIWYQQLLVSTNLLLFCDFHHKFWKSKK